LTEVVVLVAAGAILVVTTISGRLERLWLTEPLIAAMFGVVLGQFFIGPVDLTEPAFLTFLELTLALVLFSDASRVSLRRVRGTYTWPGRMLVLGLPLAIGLGTAAAAWLLGLPLGFALLLGVVLAPTDAALAEPVLENRSVPKRVRQTLNIESGLNDGLAVPALLIAIGLLEAEEGMVSPTQAVLVFIQQLGVGIVGGVALGMFGAWLIGTGVEKGWMTPLHQKVAALSLALAGFAAVQLLGGSGFVAVFIAGGLMSHRIEMRPDYLYDFAEIEGHIMVTLAFLFVGVGPVTQMINGAISWKAALLALVALAVVRPIAIWLSLIGQKLMTSTVAFLGWFGPRGLATIVFYLLAVEELPEVPALVTEAVIATMVFSILLHGMTAVPLSAWLARKFEGMEDEEDMPEMGESIEFRTRKG
jgi:NhaP-type Na+/H+ or K+/H+ antiporter